MHELLGLPYSPWSEKARWALESRAIPYTSRMYQPLIGEPALRVKLRRWSGIVTVPVFTADDGTVLGDSADIARWADGRGDGPVLFPADAAAAIAEWVELSERGLALGRTLSLLRVLDDDAAVVELLPRRMRGVPGSRAVARFGVKRTLRKYSRDRDPESARGELVAVLERLRAAIAASSSQTGAKTLLGRFTFADIAMAQVLAFVTPPAFGLRVGKATRHSFIDDALAAEFADVLAWRDALYDAYRPRG